jgi:hypothetical protein
MAKNENQTHGTAAVQVFELTMDNPEDQDELNRQLRKPGEPVNGPSGMNGRKVQGDSPTESAEKKSRTNG